MSVIYPTGNKGRFSTFTYDGFATLTDALIYSANSQNPDSDTGMYAEVLDKSKMNEIMPDGFEHSIIYERVMSLAAEED